MGVGAFIIFPERRSAQRDWAAAAYMIAAKNCAIEVENHNIDSEPPWSLICLRGCHERIVKGVGFYEAR